MTDNMMPELTLTPDDTAAAAAVEVPSLTLTPEAPEVPKEEEKKIEPMEMDDKLLTEEEKQAVEAFSHKIDIRDMNKVQEKDRISVVGMKDFKPGKPLTVILSHADGSQDRVQVNHTYTDRQIEWFCYGSSLNMLRAQNQAKAKNA